MKRIFLCSILLLLLVVESKKYHKINDKVSDEIKEEVKEDFSEEDIEETLIESRGNILYRYEDNPISY